MPLVTLDLDSNDFTGMMSMSLFNSENLINFSVVSNLLEGSLFGEIGNIIALDKVVLSNNLLTEARSQCLKKFGIPLMLHDLDFNNFIGVILVSRFNSKDLIEFSIV
ncbi:hypothetical protein WN944_022804 [Citrus x changshan-huyou]|uniref:Uncharacterized protein n=1 Tax=Citrus x changshan-huyou TaxID=2935761 RepID=A0AAP0N1D9_9ROSI